MAAAAMAVPGMGNAADESVDDPVMQFFHSATAYDIMPENGKVVVVDAQLPLVQVFRVFVEQSTTCAVVWTEAQGCAMLLNPTHLIQILLHYTDEVGVPTLAEKLGQVTVADWLATQAGSVPTEMASVPPEVSLYDAICSMEAARCSTMPVVERTSATMAATVLHIITFPRILRYVMAHFHNDNDELLNKSIDDLGIGYFQAAEMVTMSTETKLSEAFSLMVSRQLACIPIVDEEGVVVDVMSQSDVTLAARSASYDCLERPARSLLLENGNPQESLHTCMRSEALISVLRRLVTTGADRLICIDVSGHLEGVVTLNHIFGHFIQLVCNTDGAKEAEGNEGEGPPPAEEDEVEEQFGRFMVTDLEEDA